jgi:hypothetical protein
VRPSGSQRPLWCLPIPGQRAQRTEGATLHQGRSWLQPKRQHTECPQVTFKRPTTCMQQSPRRTCTSLGAGKCCFTSTRDCSV